LRRPVCSLGRRELNETWATAEGVASLFTETAVYISPDKTTYRGRAALTERLNEGTSA